MSVFGSSPLSRTATRWRVHVVQHFSAIRWAAAKARLAVEIIHARAGVEQEHGRDRLIDLARYGGGADVRLHEGET